MEEQVATILAQNKSIIKPLRGICMPRTFRRADTAQVCNDVGFGATDVTDGQCECSFAIPARQIVSERW